MKVRLFNSLKTQIVFFIVIAIALSSGVVAAVIISVNYHNTLEQMKIDGISLAKSNAYNIKEKLDSDQSLESLQQVVLEMGEDQNLEYCAIIDVNGIDIADSKVEDIGESFADDPATQNVINNGSIEAGFWTDDSGLKVLDVMVPLNAVAGDKKVAIVDIGISIDGLTKTLFNSIINNAIISIISIIFFSLIISLFIDKRIIRPIRKMTMVTKQLAKGETDIIINEKFKGELCELRDSFFEIIDRTKEQAEVIQKIAHGNFDFNVVPASERDIVFIEMIRMRDMINEILMQVEFTVEDLIQGKLSARIKEEGYEGKWKMFVMDMDDLINTLVMPLNTMAEYLNRISQGNIPKKIDEDYKGDFGKMKDCINTCIDVMNELINAATTLTEAVHDGNLEYTTDSSKLGGSWKELVNGMNNILIEVATPINEVKTIMSRISAGDLQAEVSGEYRGEFDVLKQAANLISSRLRIVVSEISGIISQIADGNIDLEQVRMYHGDFMTISTSLNTIIESLNTVLSEIGQASDEVAAGSNQLSIGSQVV